jgi:hypothetical protein
MKVLQKEDARAKLVAEFIHRSNEPKTIALIMSQLGHMNNTKTLNKYIKAAIKYRKASLKKGA